MDSYTGKQKEKAKINEPLRLVINAQINQPILDSASCMKVAKDGSVSGPV